MPLPMTAACCLKSEATPDAELCVAPVTQLNAISYVAVQKRRAVASEY